jgi:hypothetical protein
MGLYEKYLEELREILMEITHLQRDRKLIDEICNGYLQDSSFNGTSLLAGMIHDPKTGFY